MKYFTLSILALATIMALMGIAKHGNFWFITAISTLSAVGLLLLIKNNYFRKEDNKNQ